MTAGVPKIPIDKDSNLITGQYNIWFAWKICIIFTVSNPPLPQSLAE